MPRKRVETFRIGAQLFDYHGVTLLITYNSYGVVQDIRPVPKDKSKIDEGMQVDILRAEMDRHHYDRFRTKHE